MMKNFKPKIHSDSQVLLDSDNPFVSRKLIRRKFLKKIIFQTCWPLICLALYFIPTLAFNAYYFLLNIKFPPPTEGFKWANYKFPETLDTVSKTYLEIYKKSGLFEGKPADNIIKKVLNRLRGPYTIYLSFILKVYGVLLRLMAQPLVLPFLISASRLYNIFVFGRNNNFEEDLSFYGSPYDSLSSFYEAAENLSGSQRITFVAVFCAVCTLKYFVDLLYVAAAAYMLFSSDILSNFFERVFLPKNILSTIFSADTYREEIEDRISSFRKRDKNLNWYILLIIKSSLILFLGYSIVDLRHVIVKLIGSGQSVRIYESFKVSSPFSIDLMSYVASDNFTAISLLLVSNLLFYLMIFIISLISIRLLIFIFDENLNLELACAKESIQILIQLHQPNVLDDLGERSLLAYRVEYLSEMVLRLSSKYSSPFQGREAWIKDHFLAMYAFLQERIQWINVPQTLTLFDLRNDFRFIARIFVTQRYGDFHDYSAFKSWKLSYPEASGPNQTWQQKTFLEFRRIVGILLPLIGMGYIIFAQNVPFVANTLDEEMMQVIIYIFLAWLLVGIDNIFRLRIVESILSAASGLKKLR